MQPSILVVDDEPLWRGIVSNILLEKGYRIHVVSSHTEAMEALETRVFHLAIIDLRLEGESTAATGVSLLEHIAQRNSGLPYIIVLTGYPTIPIARQSFREHKVWDFITKLDFDSSVFLQTVFEAVNEAVKSKVVVELNTLWRSLFGMAQTSSPYEDVTVLTDLLFLIADALQLPKPTSPTQYERWWVSHLLVGSIFNEVRIPEYLSIVVLRGNQLQDTDFDELRTIPTAFFPSPAQMPLLLITHDKQKEQAKPLLRRMRRAYSYDIVPLCYEDTIRIINSSDPPSKFREFILSHVNLVTVSPFITTGPALGRIFFGREHELREIIEHSLTQSYAIIGGRRIGKTSILKQLEQIRLPDAGFHAFYHDCSFTPFESELVQTVATTWFSMLPRSAPRSFNEIAQLLPGDKSIVIIFDEVDGLINTDAASDYPFFNTLRGIASAGYCRFILSGEARLRSELTNPNSPLYNFANEMIIGRLDFHAVEELVTRPMKQLEIELEDETTIVRNVWDITSGHPNVVQRLCQRLILRLNHRLDRRLTLRDIEEVAMDPDFLRKDFLTIYWERATTLERLCSLLMAADNNIHALVEVQKALTKRGIQVSLNQVDSALERLVDLRNILTRSPEGYKFAVTAFPQVISKTARLADLIALNQEDYQRFGDVEPKLRRGVL